MLQKQPTPPGKGGAGNVTCLAACELPEHSLKLLRVQRLIARTGVSPVFASIAEPFIFGGAA